MTPIGIPLGGGFNVGWGDGFSLGQYVEAGYRVGGTGFGAGATVSQSFDYNFKHQNASTTTSAGAYASFSVFNVGVGASQTYDISNDQWHDLNWSVSVGVGVGFEQGRGAIGLNASYGSAGWGYGLGGIYYAQKRSLEYRISKTDGKHNIVEGYDNSPMAKLNDKILKSRIFDEYSVKEGDIGIKKITTTHGKKYKLTTKGMYLRKKRLVGGYVTLNGEFI